MKLLLGNKRFITLGFVLVLILLAGQTAFAQTNYCGPQSIIDKCNPNRVSMEIEIYDITSSLNNRRRDEKKYQYKLDYKVTDNQLGTVIGSQNNIGPAALTNNNSQPHYRLDVINQPNYLAKDLPNFRLVFSFKLHDVSFTKLARIYWKGFFNKRSFKRKQYGVYQNFNVYLKEVSVKYPITALDECVYDTLDPRPLRRRISDPVSILNEGIDYPLHKLLIRGEYTYPDDMIVTFDGGITFLIRIKWQKLNEDATKIIVNHPFQQELNLCANEYPYVFRGPDPNFESCQWQNISQANPAAPPNGYSPRIIQNTLGECLYIESKEQVGDSTFVNYYCGSGANDCSNQMPIVFKTIQEPDIKIMPGRDTMICRGQSVKFTVPSGHISYKWFKIFKVWTDICGRTQSDKECIAQNDTSLNVSEPGTYMVEIVSSNGCIVRDTVVVSGSVIPSVKINASTFTLCSGQAPVSLAVNNSSNYTAYTWSTSSSTSQISASSFGKYWVQAKDNNLCVSSDTVEINSLGCDGLYNGQAGHSIVKQLNLATVNLSNPSTTAIVLNDNATPATNDVSKSLYFARFNYHRSGKTDISTNNFRAEINYDIKNNGATIPGYGNQILKIADINDPAKFEKVAESVRSYNIQNPVNPTLQINSIAYYDQNGAAISPPSTATLNDINIELEKKTYLVPDINSGISVPQIQHTEISPLANNYKLQIAWQPLKQAVEYELQWAFIDDASYEQLTPENLLKERSVSIVTPENYYVLDMAYPKGRLYYRVRPISRFTSDTKNNFEHLRYGSWNTSSVYVISTGFEDTLSWQRTSTFAEEGKKKDVITFYDQSLRAAQVVTNLNREQLSLAAETYYDYEGRATLNVLPVPSDDNNLLFKRNLNKVAGHALSKNDFDQGIQPVLDNTNGSAKYYSAYNPFINHTRYFANTSKIPHANGYVTTQTQFTRDATGRPMKQSGVGSEFALDRYDSDGNTQKHYTQYFYGAVPDNELIRLFGSNTGKSRHYRKNFVIDPNDQISVSYTDMFGRTVATCLSGQVPQNVTSIGTDSGLFVMPLHNNNIYDKEARTVSLSYPFGNTIKAQNNRDTFEYSLEGWVNELNNTGIQICQTCQYQLSIRLNDPSGAPVTLTQLSAPQPNVQFVNGNKNLNAVFGKDVPCTTPPVSYPKIVFSAPVNKIGTYTVVKELKILTDPIDSIKMDTIHGAVSYQRFKDSLLNTLLDSTSCDFGCSQYVIKYLNDSLLASDQHRRLDTLTMPGDKDLYHYYYTKWCDLKERILGDTSRLAFQQCESIYEQILAAVSPGGKFFTESFIMQYRNIVPDLYGKSFAEIRSMWKADYADSFAVFHPEYCHYEACINDSVSNRLDVKLSRIFTWSEAKTILGTPENPLAYDPDFALYQQKFNQYYEVVINRNVLDNPMLNLYDFIDWTHQNYGAYPPYSASMIVHEYEPQSVMYPDVDFTGYSPNPASPYQYGLPKTVINRLDTLKWFHFRNLMTAIRKEAKAIQLEANGCRFLPDDSAIVAYPIANRGQVPNGREADSMVRDVCRQTCEGFADRYYPRVLAYCHQGIALNMDDSLELRRLLTKYCNDNCGIDNPLGLLKPEDVTDAKTDSIRAFLGKRNYLCAWDSIATYNVPVHYQYVVDPATGDTLKVTVCTPDGIEALMVYARSNLLNYYTNDTSGRALALQTLQQWGVTPNTLLLKDDHITFMKGQNGDCNNAPCVTTIYFLDSLGNKVHNIQEIIWSRRILTSPLSQNVLYQFYANKIVPYFAQYEVVVIHLENGVLKYKRVFLYMLNYNWQGSGCGLDFKGNCTSKPIQTWAFSASVDSFVTTSVDSCYRDITERAENLLKDYYQLYLDSLKLALYNAYLDNCFKIKETFLLKYKLNEYQYTLYYYDQAGNLVQTVPPQGVYPLKSTDFSASGVWNGVQPDHVLKTQYRYNTRNQVVWQRTPDADSTCFWYNAKGQLILSQNAKQKPKNKFSFTFYDHLGRILCVGEIDSAIAHFRGGMDAVLDSLRFPMSPSFVPKEAIRQLTLTRYDNPVLPLLSGFTQENLRNRVAANYYAEQFTTDDLLQASASPNNTDMLFRNDIASALSGKVVMTAYSYDEVGNVKTLVQSLNTLETVMGDTAIVLPPVQGFNTDSTGLWASNNAKIVRSYYNTVPGLNAMKLANTDGTNTASQTATLTNSLQYSVVSGKTYTVMVDMGFIAPNPQSGNTIKAKILKGTAVYAQAATATAITNGTYSFAFTPNFTGTIKITYDVVLQKAHSVYLDNVKLYYIEPKAYVVTSPNYKRVDYNYDLISGKVNKVSYQRDKPDQFIHQYEYDADNRITDVYTSRDGILFTKEAKYFYYPHGPLARIEIGQDKVQGVDYYYTLQGWLKGINNSAIAENNDPGQDSVFVVVNTTNGGRDTLNKYIPKDQYNTLMAYYKGDYAAIDNSTAQPYEFNSTAPNNSAMPFYTRSGLSDKFKGLYNGNIAFIASGMPALAQSTPTNYSMKWLLEEYKYDQLNRIVESQSLLPHATTLNSYLTAITNKARTSYTYDKNGNILKLNRSSYTAAAPTTAALMDSLTYIYPVNTTTGKLTNNKLYHVNDLQTNKTAFTEDIDDQGVLGAQLAGANYDYDAIGQLTKDNAENIDSIRWNVYGKIEKIFFKNGKAAMEFLYDASGNRIAKLLKNAKHPVPAGKDSTYEATYYWRDAQGNVLATERKRFYPIPGTFTGTAPLGGWQGHAVDVEYVLYGSSRLGALQDTLRYDIATPSAYGQYVRWQGRRQYELSNHLGNVMVTLSDVKTYAVGTKGAVGYLAKVATAQQYYPFGMQMPGKNITLASYSSLNRYRFSFNGKEKDDEVQGQGNWQDYGMRMYSTRLGRFPSVDPLTSKYPYYSPYQFAGNMPIKYIDLDGLEPAEPGKKEGQYEIANVDGTKNSFGWTWTKDSKTNKGKPFWNQGCSTSFSSGNASKNSPDDDLTKTNHPNVDAFTMCPDENESCNLGVYKSAYNSGIQLENSSKKAEAQILINKFISGNNSTISYKTNSGMSELLSKDPAFIKVANKFKIAAMKYYKANGTLDGFEGQNYLSRPYIKDTWFMHTVMGGTQQFDAQIQKVSDNEININYKVWDHFGAGTDDGVSKLPGLPSMYSLQHNIQGTKYKPFIWNIQVETK